MTRSKHSPEYDEPEAKTPGRLISRTGGIYDGRELGCTVTRPGAMDAYKLPSLIGTKRIYRKEVTS